MAYCVMKINNVCQRSRFKPHKGQAFFFFFLPGFNLFAQWNFKPYIVVYHRRAVSYVCLSACKCLQIFPYCLLCNESQWCTPALVSKPARGQAFFFAFFFVFFPCFNHFAQWNSNPTLWYITVRLFSHSPYSVPPIYILKFAPIWCLKPNVSYFR